MKGQKRLEKSVIQASFLKKVLTLKEQLFGQFSPSITKETKKKAWMEVKEYAISIGLIPSSKDYTYVRDATWPNLRNRTMIKVDGAKKTGEAGGPHSKFDDCDYIVLEIIGKESPVIDGIGVCDSFGEIPRTTPTEDEEQSSLQSPPSQESVSPSVSQGVVNKKKKRIIVRTSEETKTLEELKIKKLKLEIRKLELEVWEKERNLELSHCSLTKDMKKEQVINVEDLCNQQNV